MEGLLCDADTNEARETQSKVNSYLEIFTKIHAQTSNIVCKRVVIELSLCDIKRAATANQSVLERKPVQLPVRIRRQHNCHVKIDQGIAEEASRHLRNPSRPVLVGISSKVVDQNI